MRAPPSSERVAIALMAAAVTALCAYSLVVTLSRPSSVTLPSGREAVVIEAHEDRWVPRTFVVDADAGTLVLVRNPDWIAHTFAVPELGIDVYVAPRGEHVVELQQADARTYRFECSVTGHEEMTGTFRVS